MTKVLLSSYRSFLPQSSISYFFSSVFFFNLWQAFRVETPLTQTHCFLLCSVNIKTLERLNSPLAAPLLTRRNLRILRRYAGSLEVYVEKVLNVQKSLSILFNRAILAAKFRVIFGRRTNVTSNYTFLKCPRRQLLIRHYQDSFWY